MELVSHPANRTNGRWTKEEHRRFLEGLELFGKDWKKIENHVITRSGAQIRSHAQKYFIKVGKESNEQENTHEEVESSNMEPALEDQTSEYSFFFSKMYNAGKLSLISEMNFWNEFVQVGKKAEETIQNPRKASFVSVDSQGSDWEGVRPSKKQSLL